MNFPSIVPSPRQRADPKSLEAERSGTSPTYFCPMTEVEKISIAGNEQYADVGGATGGTLLDSAGLGQESSVDKNDDRGE